LFEKQALIEAHPAGACLTVGRVSVRAAMRKLKQDYRHGDSLFVWFRGVRGYRTISPIGLFSMTP